MSGVVLTAEQKSFLEECEIEFSNRYTTEDEDYKKIYESDIPSPPVMSPWYGRPKLVARRRGYGDHRYGEHREDRNRDRDHRGHSNYNQQSDHRYRPY